MNIYEKGVSSSIRHRVLDDKIAEQGAGFVESRLLGIQLLSKNRRLVDVRKVNNDLEYIQEQVKMSKSYGPPKKLTSKKSKISISGKIPGYHLHLPSKERHRILNNEIASGQRTGLSLQKALLARRTLGKNKKTKEQYDTWTDDAEYVYARWHHTPYWNPK